MTFQEFTSLHPELADDARSLSFTSYMQGMEDARQIDTHGTIQPILANIATELSNAEEKWHFWPNMSEIEDVVYVTDKFNPYK